MFAVPNQPWSENTRRLRGERLELDLHCRSVTRDGLVRGFNPRCFDLLLFLREPRRLCTREKVFHRVRAGVVVDDVNLSTSIWTLRKAHGDGARGCVRTVAKQSYMFDPTCDPEPETSVDAIRAACAARIVEPVEQPRAETPDETAAARGIPLVRSRWLRTTVAVAVLLALPEIVLLRREGNIAEAARLLQEAHTPARERGDVLAELAIHGIAGPELASFCPAGRQARLAAKTGTHGTSGGWLIAASTTGARGNGAGGRES